MCKYLRCPSFNILDVLNILVGKYLAHPGWTQWQGNIGDELKLTWLVSQKWFDAPFTQGYTVYAYMRVYMCIIYIIFLSIHLFIYLFIFFIYLLCWKHCTRIESYRTIDTAICWTETVWWHDGLHKITETVQRCAANFPRGTWDLAAGPLWRQDTLTRPGSLLPNYWEVPQGFQTKPDSTSYVH